MGQRAYFRLWTVMTRPRLVRVKRTLPVSDLLEGRDEMGS